MIGVNVGDLVRVRDFDDMSQEFVLDYQEDLLVGGRYFTQKMRYLSGFQFVVGSVSEKGIVKPNEDTPFLRGWALTEGMLDVIFEDVVGSATRDSSKLRDDLILTSYENDHFQLKVSSNYGQEIDVEILAKKAFQNLDEDIFYFEIEDDYNERDTQCLGLSLGKVERLANYLMGLVDDVEGELVQLILEDIFKE